jgi:hypothetical protein
MLTVLVSLLLMQPPPQNLIDERPDPKDMILIDGSKEPQRIPDWSAWRTAFRLIGKGKTRDDLPTELFHIVSAADVALIFGAANASLDNDAAYERRGTELYDKLLAVRQACDAKEEAAANRKACFIKEGNLVSGGWRDEEIAFRQRTLDIRDQLLQQLDERGKADVQLALTAWVESRKAGMKAYIHKPNLAHYYKPR